MEDTQEEGVHSRDPAQALGAEHGPAENSLCVLRSERPPIIVLAKESDAVLRSNIA